MKNIFFAFFCSIVFTLSADSLSPSNYTQQVVSDVDSIISTFDSLETSYISAITALDNVLTYSSPSNRLTSSDRLNLTNAKSWLSQSYTTTQAITNYLYGIKRVAQNLSYVEYSLQNSTDMTIVTNIYNVLIDTFINQGYLLNWVDAIRVKTFDIQSSLGTLTNLVSLIQEELYTPNHYKNLGEYITDIYSHINNMSPRIKFIQDYLENLNSWMEYFDTDLFQRYFVPYMVNMGNNWTNRFWNVGSNRPLATTNWPEDYTYHWLGEYFNEPYFDLWTPFPARSDALSFYTFLQWYMDNMPAYFSSLNNYAYTNLFTLNTIAANTSKLDFGSITDAIFSAAGSITNEISRQFSIFNVSSPLQSYYNVNNNSTNAYYNFLTNYYLSVSLGRSSGSASESHTNWFSRIEMLLGALVFKDASDGSFSANTPNTDGVENAYDAISESLSTAVNIPSSFQTKIEDAEQSILDYMQEWHAIISSATLGSQFTLCDVQLTDSTNDSSTRDGSSSFDGRMNLSIPIDGDFKRFLDVSRALSTVCLITLFLIMSLKLIIFLLRACATITRVCYALFVAILGH